MPDDLFAKIETYISTADSFLARVQDENNPEADYDVKDLFTRSLVMIIVSEYESYIESIFATRIESCKDAGVINIAKKHLDRRFRSPDLKKINEILGLFGETIKDAFISSTNIDGINASWDNIMKARHAIVHKQGTLQLSYEDAKSEYFKTKKVISGICEALVSTDVDT